MHTKIKVELSHFQVFMSGMVGVSRHVKCLDQKYGYSGIDNRKIGWQVNCEGALGEQALAKYLDVYWDGSPGIFRDRPDVQDYEVRTSPRSDGGLLIRDRDKDESIYILILGYDCPTFYLAGWATGAQVREKGEVRVLDVNRPPCFVLDQHKLNPMETLPK